MPADRLLGIVLEVAAMENTVRVQFYHWDVGLFWKSYIQRISREEFEAIRHADKGPKVIEVTPDDWYGRKLPTTLRDTCRRKG